MIYSMILSKIGSLTLLSVSNINNTASWLTFAKAVGQLFFLIFLFVGLYFLLVKMRTNIGASNTKKNTIQIIERKFLNNYSSLTLTKINNKVLLLGITKEQITLLAEFNEDEFELEGDSTKFKEIFDNKFLNFGNYKNRSTYEKEEN